MNTATPKCSCSCNQKSGPPALVYACSGAADVGEIADRAARLLDREDRGWMSCLAGIGGRVSGLVASAPGAPSLIAIDGCPHDCGKKTLELAGFTGINHIRVTDLGFVKGESSVVAQAIRRVADAAVSSLETQPT